MGFKPRPPTPTLSENFRSLMDEARQADDGIDRIVFSASVAVRCAAYISPEELTYEQWKEVARAVQAIRHLCDTLLPDLRNKVRIAETIGWIK